jgi:hypothetical protein
MRGLQELTQKAFSFSDLEIHNVVEMAKLRLLANCAYPLNIE